MQKTNEEEKKEVLLTVPSYLHKGRFDAVLSALLPDHSRSVLQKYLKKGFVELNGNVCESAKTPVNENDVVKITFPAVRQSGPIQVEGEDIPLDILFEDENMLVVNKAPGMVVHPAAGNWSGTLVNALAGKYPSMGDDFADVDSSRPGIVHRLDKDTSGCLVVAKTPAALYKLAEAFQDKNVKKTYYAIVCGILKEKRGEIINLIGRHPADRKKMAVVQKNGREAITRYRVIAEGTDPDGRKASLIKVRILTGRTHQIRVHMAFLGHPVAGDSTYGGAKKIPEGRQMLHAKKLVLPHPVSGEALEISSPFPEDFRQCMARFHLELPE
ncbi:MAG: RluA family pseudouridine synthase [Lentisphaeria bacterium]|nr:RluA family pseudouridine synthase [Lentisphaeria bacterium]